MKDSELLRFQSVSSASREVPRGEIWKHNNKNEYEDYQKNKRINNKWMQTTENPFLFRTFCPKVQLRALLSDAFKD